MIFTLLGFEAFLDDGLNAFHGYIRVSLNGEIARPLYQQDFDNTDATSFCRYVKLIMLIIDWLTSCILVKEWIIAYSDARAYKRFTWEGGFRV